MGPPAGGKEAIGARGVEVAVTLNMALVLLRVADRSGQEKRIDAAALYGTAAATAVEGLAVERRSGHVALTLIRHGHRSMSL